MDDRIIKPKTPPVDIAAAMKRGLDVQDLQVMQHAISAGMLYACIVVIGGKDTLMAVGAQNMLVKVTHVFSTTTNKWLALGDEERG